MASSPVRRSATDLGLPEPSANERRTSGGPRARSEATEARAARVVARPRLALVAILVMQSMLMLDLGAVTISVPEIQDGLEASVSELQFILAIYSLAYAVTLVPGGRLGDLYGRRRVLLIGVGAFTLASLVAAAAPSAGFVVTARLLAGLSAALVAPQILAVIQVTFPPADRPRALGLWASAGAMGMVIGLVGSGLLMKADVLGLGWRAVLVVEACLGVAAFALARTAIGETRSGGRRALDLGGVGVLSVALLLIVYPLIAARTGGWDPWVWACLGASIPILVLFVRHERSYAARTGSPLLDLTLFRFRAFSIGLAAAFAFFSSSSVFLFLFTLLTQIGLGYSTLASGLMFAVAPFGFFLSSRQSARLATGMGRNAVVLGIFVTGAGLALLGVSVWVAGDSVGPAVIIPGTFLTAVGHGFTITQLLAFTLSEVHHDHAGAAGGAFAATQQLAIAVGVAMVGLVFYGVLDPAGSVSDYTAAFGITMVTYMLGLNLFVLCLVPFLPRWPQPAGARQLDLDDDLEPLGRPEPQIPA